MDNISIRKATEDDLLKILDLYSGIENETSNVLDLVSARKQFQKIRSYPNYSVYVAEKDGEIVGTFELLIMDNLAHSGKPSAIVEDVVVNEQNRNGGIGRIMMQFAMEQCKKYGCYKLMLSSNLSRERAHKFYDDLGFTRHGYSFIVNL
jgi:GNAT superfamily N-acetyltransferase